MATLILWGLAAALGTFAYTRPGALHVEGLRTAYRHLIQVLPRVALALITAGFLAQIIPHELMAEWLGPQSGLRGVAIAALAGGVVPGGPIIAFPIAVVLLKSGAGTPQLIAFLTAWSVFALHRVITYELPFMGWRFSLTRFLSSLPLPFATGLLAGAILGAAGG